MALYRFVAERASFETALGYVARIESYCLGLKEFPERGTRRDEVRKGLRTIGFERRATIAFHLDTDTVFIDRILYGGRDLEAALSNSS